MKLREPGDTPKLVIELEHEDETLVFHFKPIDGLSLIDFYTLSTISGKARAILGSVLQADGVTRHDGSEIPKADLPAALVNLPTALLAKLVTSYVNKVTEIMLGNVDEDDPKKKPEPNE